MMFFISTPIDLISQRIVLSDISLVKNILEISKIFYFGNYKLFLVYFSLKYFFINLYLLLYIV